MATINCDTLGGRERENILETRRDSAWSVNKFIISPRLSEQHQVDGMEEEREVQRDEIKRKTKRSL